VERHHEKFADYDADYYNLGSQNKLYKTIKKGILP